MKNILSLLMLALCLSGAPLHASDPSPAAPSRPIEPEVELAALDRFLDLTDEELDQMQRAIALIRGMSAGEKAALRIEMDKFRRLSDDQRRQLRRGWGAVEADLQDAWRTMMYAATPERRAEIQTQLQALPPEKKADYRRRLAEEFLRRQAKK